MVRVVMWTVLLAAPLLAQQGREPLHPLLDRYLRGQAGKFLPDVPFNPFNDSIPARYVQRMNQWKEGEDGVKGDAQFFLSSNQDRLLLVGDTVVLVKNRGQLIWMTTSSLRVPLRISSSYSVFGDGNVTDVLGLPLHLYQVAQERREEGRVVLWLEPRPEAKEGEQDLAYSYVEVEADQQNGDLTKMTFFGLDKSKAIKEMVLDQYRDFGEGFRMPRKTIRDLIFGGANDRTVIEVIEITKEKLPASFFNPNQSSLARFIRRYKE